MLVIFALYSKQISFFFLYKKSLWSWRGEPSRFSNFFLGGFLESGFLYKKTCISDPISQSYVCMWNWMQHGHDMKHLTQIPNRSKCARECYNNPECIGFEYYPAGNKDCYLSKTPWQKVQPANTGGKWSCEHKGGKLLFIDHNNITTL